jgi:hypothetical protein
MSTALSGGLKQSGPLVAGDTRRLDGRGRRQHGRRKPGTDQAARPVVACGADRARLGQLGGPLPAAERVTDTG